MEQFVSVVLLSKGKENKTLWGRPNLGQSVAAPHTVYISPKVPLQKSPTIKIKTPPISPRALIQNTVL